jgi:hypothetical protein
MFNTYNTVNHKYPDTINHHEHKAPTDESIRILSEMEQKTLDKILFSRNISNNNINSDWHIFNNPKQLRLDFIGNVDINGAKKKIEFSIRYEELRDSKYTSQKVGEIIINSIYEKISKSLALNLFTKSTDIDLIENILNRNYL